MSTERPNIVLIQTFASTLTIYLILLGIGGDKDTANTLTTLYATLIPLLAGAARLRP